MTKRKTLKARRRQRLRRCERCGIRMRRGARRKRCQGCNDLICGGCLTEHGHCVECEDDVQHARSVVLAPDESAIVLRNDRSIDVFASTKNNDAGRNSAACVAFINRLLGHNDLCQLVDQLMKMGAVGGRIVNLNQVAQQLGSPQAEIDPKDLN